MTFLVHFHKYQVKEDVCASIDYIAESGPRMSQSIYSKLGGELEKKVPNVFVTRE